MTVSKVAFCSSINNMAVAKEEEEEEEEAADWSDLTYHLLDLIMDNLISPSISDYFSRSISDYICFGSVCMSWRSAFKDHNPRLLPLLMVPPCFDFFSYLANFNCYRAIENKKMRNKKMKQLRLRGFYSIFNRKVDDRLMVRMPNYQQCRGSSHGWLITVDDIEEYFRVQLFNPFLSSSSSSSSTGDAIVLPPLQSIKDASRVHDYGYLRKAILSTDPVTNPTEYMVMIIYSYSSKLALLKPGDKAWTRIKSPRAEPCKKGHFADVIYYQGKFFAINKMGLIVVCDCDDVAESITARVLLQPPKIPFKNSSIKYLVESSGGNLLQVHRETTVKISNNDYATIRFRVFKLLHQTTKLVHQIRTEEDYEWVELKNLCGDAMFLGHNASMSIPATDYPGCKPNCIYYTDDSDYCIDDPYQGPFDIGVFNLEKGSFDRYFRGKKKPLPCVSIWPVPIWIQPSLQKSITSSSLSDQNCL